MRSRSIVVAEALGGVAPLRRPLTPGEAPPNPAPAGSAGLGLARAAEQDPVVRLGEKVRTAVLAGRVSFLPWLDPYTEETPAMRRMYSVMLRNAVVKQALHHKICSVASLDLQVTPAGETDRDHEVADFTRYCYEDAMEGGLLGMAEELLQPALIFKSAIAEKVWQPELWERGKFAGKRFYRAFKSKEYAEPLYDEFRNFVGVRAQGFGQSEVFPASDFVFLKNWPLFGGPGMSDLRAAYHCLWQLDTLETMHRIHLERYLSPVMTATYGNGFNLAQVEKLQDDLAGVRGRGWLTVPESVKVESLQMALRGEAEYLDKCKDLREQIALSITGAYLQMLTATPQGEIRGNSETHRSTAELLVWELAARFVGALNTQATPQLVQLNYAGADYPKASLGGVNYQELKASIEIDTAAQKMGVPLSLKATARKYSLQVATDPADTLKPAPPGGLGGFGGGLPFADPPQPRPGAPGGAAGATEGQEFTDGEGNTWRFCGGPGSGKPGPCPQGKGKPAPKGRKVAAVPASTAPSATHADPMHGHPFAGKSRDEIVATLTKQSDPQTAPDNPRGYDTTRYPAGVDGPRFVATVTSMVGRAQQANPFQRPTLPAVYEAAKAAQPGLTLAAFQASIVKAAKDGAIELGAFTQATSELPHPEHAIPLHREKLYYVRVPERRFADPSPTALAGPDGARAEQLLAKAQAHGTAVLGTLAARAVGRLLAGGDPQRALQAGRLFTPGERRVLAGALASALAPAELLGRARIARRAAQVAERHADAQEFCGGKGGKPGPCPTGVAERPARGGAATADYELLKQHAQTVKLSSSEKGAVHDYTLGQNEDIGPALRQGQMPADRDAQATVKHLDGILARTPTLAAPVQVQRGISFKDPAAAASFMAELDRHAAAGKPVRFGDYQSTTADPTIAEQFLAGHGRAQAGALLEIEAHHGLAMEGFSGGKDAKREKEFLLPRGQSFEVLGRTEREIGGKRVPVYRLRQTQAGAAQFADGQCADHFFADDPLRRRAVQRFSDEPTDLRCFDETGPLAPMAPAEAVSYFRKLVPGLTVDAAALAAATGRQAFSLAVTTDATLLAKVQGIIAGRLESGEDVRGAVGEVQALLDQAGVTVSNPAYADMVVRTNLMDAFTEGSQRELAGHTEMFPVCRYLNPDDGRSRPEHAARSGRYYDSGTAFADVRGRDIADAANCRCNFAAVDRWEWAELQAQGAQVDL